MKRSFLTLILSTLIISCVPKDHVLEIEVINNSSEPIEDVRVITGGDKISFKADVLPAGQKIDHTLNIPEAFFDGGYTFRFTRSNGEEMSTTGNYSDEGEGQLKKTLVFEVQEQDVTVNEKVLEVE